MRRRSRGGADKPGNRGNVGFLSSAGLSEIEPGSAEALAKRLVRYISDPSTVRVRVMSEWGYSPTVERIRTFREDHEAQQARYLTRGRMAS